MHAFSDTTDSSSSIPPYMEALNPQQREAVETTEGAVLVLAGAGTGKTRVLTTRLAHILNTGRALPGQILAVTFTNRAAQEMKERVARMVAGPEDGRNPGAVTGSWWLGTFHALAARMLRRHADLAGLTSQFTIIDPDDQLRLIKQLMEDQRMDIKKNPPKAVLARINSFKDRALGPEEIDPAESGDAGGGSLVELYRQYQSRMKTINAADFGDLLMHVIHILRNPDNAHILAEYHNRFRYIMVDEYQDTNTAQYLWLRLLAQNREHGVSGNICCVGDDDQSIYGWRGAELGNILRFESDFPDAKVIRLEQNYRSTNTILKAAGGLIDANQSRLGKSLWSEQGKGEHITVRALWDGQAEARWVGEQMERLSRENISLDQMAVLVRAGFQMREFEERFIQLGLPYRVYGGMRFYERQEIRDALAYLRVVAQPADDLALERILNTPKRGLGNTTVNVLNTTARSRGISLSQAISELVDTDELRPNIKKSLTGLMADFQRWRKSLEGEEEPSELARAILEGSGYIDMWENAKTPDAPGRLENLKELISAIGEFDSLPDFLEHVSLVLDNEEEANKAQITLMTLHGAKGLEFDVVFLPGWEEGLFPSQRSMDENGLKALEEERRLAYVGLTRARKRAFISYAANRRMYGSWINALPSRFVEELPREFISFSSDIKSYGSGESDSPGRSPHWDSSGLRPRGRGHRQSYQAKTGNINGFQPGTKVWHKKFGQGRVINVDGHKLDIRFDTAGQKRVMDSFVDIVE